MTWNIIYLKGKGHRRRIESSTGVSMGTSVVKKILLELQFVLVEHFLKVLQDRTKCKLTPTITDDQKYFHSLETVQ